MHFLIMRPSIVSMQQNQSYQSTSFIFTDPQFFWQGIFLDLSHQEVWIFLGIWALKLSSSHSVQSCRRGAKNNEYFTVVTAALYYLQTVNLI